MTIDVSTYAKLFKTMWIIGLGVGLEFLAINILCQMYLVPVMQTINVRGEFDGKGKVYSWKGEGDCGQSEDMPPMFVLKDGATLKNLIIQNAPDGVHVEGDNVTIRNVVFPKVCEDAITAEKHNFNLKIVDNHFESCADKGLQLTDVRTAQIWRNSFYKCKQAILVKKSDQLVISNNRLEKSYFGMQIYCPARVLFQNNKFLKVKVGKSFIGNECKAREDHEAYDEVKIKSQTAIAYIELSNSDLVVLDVVDNNYAGEKYTNCLSKQMPKLRAQNLAAQAKPLSSLEQKWYEFFRNRIMIWEKEKSNIENQFGHKPLESLEIVFGNRGGSLGATYRDYRICIDLAAWAKKYGLPKVKYKAEVDEILTKQYAKLLEQPKRSI